MNEEKFNIRKGNYNWLVRLPKGKTLNGLRVIPCASWKVAILLVNSSLQVKRIEQAAPTELLRFAHKTRTQ